MPFCPELGYGTNLQVKQNVHKIEQEIKWMEVKSEKKKTLRKLENTAMSKPCQNKCNMLNTNDVNIEQEESEESKTNQEIRKYVKASKKLQKRRN